MWYFPYLFSSSGACGSLCFEWYVISENCSHHCHINIWSTSISFPTLLPPSWHIDSPSKTHVLPPNKRNQLLLRVWHPCAVWRAGASFPTSGNTRAGVNEISPLMFQLMSQQFLEKFCSIIIRWLGMSRAGGSTPAGTRPCSARPDSPATSTAGGMRAVATSASRATGSVGVCKTNMKILLTLSAIFHWNPPSPLVIIRDNLW